MLGRSTAVAALFVLLACAPTAPALRAPQAASPVEAEEAAAIVDAAVEKARRGEPELALAELRALLGRPGFDALAPSLRRVTLYDVGVIALELGDAAGAQPFLKASSEMAAATAADARERATASARLDDWSDVAAALTLHARRWPGELATVDEELIFYALWQARRQPDRSAFFALADALHAARWTPRRRSDPSWLWLPLAGWLLDRGDAERAAEVALRVTGPEDVAAMRVDRRFDAIVRANPGRFDVARARARDLERRRARVREEPRSMTALVQLAGALLDGHAYGDVLRVTEKPIAALDAGAATPWDDAAEMAPELMELRSLALSALERQAEALELMNRATTRPGGRGGNVGQILDLAYLQCSLDRPRDALSTLDRVPLAQTSPRGHMIMERIRALSAARLGDAPAVERALAYLRDHRLDDPAMLQQALAFLGREDEAAAVFVSRLDDALVRSDALREARPDDPPPRTELEKEWYARWDAMLARPEVQAAIAKVGRIEGDL